MAHIEVTHHMPNFKKLAKNYEKHGIIALQKFIQIPSVYDESTIQEGAPYGKEVKNALDYFAKLGRDNGFAVKRFLGHVTELSIGEEGPLIGIYGHSDVVPVSGKWSHPPFGGEMKDGRVWGRGACDDKGPLLASFYATKLLKDNGLLKGFRVKIVSGGDEERGSSCLTHYFHEDGGEEPSFGFTPDANWPLIYAEKGISRYTAHGNVNLGPVVAMEGGTVSNAVCDSVLVTLPMDKAFVSYLKKNAYKVDINESPALLIVRFLGVTAHGSTPELGDNAMKHCFDALGDFYHIEAAKKIANALADSRGKAFNGQNSSPELGDATYNFGVVLYRAGHLSITIDFRYGETAKPEELIAGFGQATGLELRLDSRSDLLLFDKKSALVSTLMKAYKKETHKFFAKPLAIGGGTYAKEAKNTVAFGAEWPGHEGNMHSPDEYIYVDDFVKDIAIYARAIYMLGNLHK